MRETGDDLDDRRRADPQHVAHEAASIFSIVIGSARR
jgi:hypothetical protein